ncbi:hypothetical protein [Brevibacterium casei]|nr:hypothetical protein [Brevibacterium casei]
MSRKQLINSARDISVIDFLKNRKVQIAAQAVVITGLVGGTVPCSP